MANLRVDYETLATLLASLFNSSEVRRMLRSAYPELVAELPDDPAPVAQIIHDTVRLLDRRGLIDQEFFKLLITSRPTHADEITTLASLWRSGREAPRARVNSSNPPSFSSEKTESNRSSGLRAFAPSPMTRRKCGLVIPMSSDPSTYWAEVRQMIVDSLSNWSINLIGGNDNVIHKRVLERLRTDFVVIFDLSDLNPNVMYELGLRTALGKPAVIIADSNTPIPFDLAMVRCLLYPKDLRPSKVIEFKRALAEAMESAAASAGLDQDTQFSVSVRNGASKDAAETSTWNGRMEDRLKRIENILLTRLPVAKGTVPGRPSGAYDDPIVLRDIRREVECMIRALIGIGVPADVAIKNASDALEDLGAGSSPSMVERWWQQRHKSLP